MRGIAVLLVLANHAAGSHFPGGGLGVDVFFVLSGFLITTLLIEERALTGHMSLRNFYIRRSLRLLPALLLVVGVFAVSVRLLAWMPEITPLVTWRDVLGPLLYIQNFVVMANHDAPSLMPHTWSLAVEEQFYILWPLVLLFVVRRGSTDVIARWLWAAAGIAVAVMAVRTRMGVLPVQMYAGPEGRGAVMLLTGAGLAYWARTGVTGTIAGLARWTWPAAAGVLATLVCTVNQQSQMLYWGGWLVVAVVVALLLVATLQADTLLAKALSWPVLGWFGTISYSLYLWSVPLLILTSAVVRPRGATSEMVAAIAVPAAVVLAAGSYYLMERPLAKYGCRLLLNAKEGAVTSDTVRTIPAFAPSLPAPESGPTRSHV